jgi:hypothetical protein
LNATPVNATAFGLVRVIFNTEATPALTDVGVKAFATVMRLNTVNVPFTLAVLPALVVVTTPVLLTTLPTALLVTLALKVQLPLAGTLPPLKTKEVPLAAAVKVPAQPAVPPTVVVGVAVLDKENG